MTDDCLIVIPARFGSTRFPGKVLADLGGRSILQWCWENAKKASVGHVLIATENEKVVTAAAAFGAHAVITSSKCVSGSDRVFEASRKHSADFIINIQADQPFLSSRAIKAVANILRKNPKADIATAVIPLKDPKRLANPNVVKAVMAQSGRCLYFSRSPIPFFRNGKEPDRFEHLGIYGFRRKTLERFVKLKPAPLEMTESLEQLRALDAGMEIHAAIVSEIPCSIDTPKDLKEAQKILKQMPRLKTLGGK
jgi:3-deoxy-manno-octulosonate cytidylyltransferase (CMP-KDO synthetase)